MVTLQFGMLQCKFILPPASWLHSHEVLPNVQDQNHISKNNDNISSSNNRANKHKSILVVHVIHSFLNCSSDHRSSYIRDASSWIYSALRAKGLWHAGLVPLQKLNKKLSLHQWTPQNTMLVMVWFCLHGLKLDRIMS